MVLKIGSDRLVQLSVSHDSGQLNRTVVGPELDQLNFDWRTGWFLPNRLVKPFFFLATHLVWLPPLTVAGHWLVGRRSPVGKMPPSLETTPCWKTQSPYHYHRNHHTVTTSLNLKLIFWFSNKILTPLSQFLFIF